MSNSKQTDDSVESKEVESKEIDLKASSQLENLEYRVGEIMLDEKLNCAKNDVASMDPVESNNNKDSLNPSESTGVMKSTRLEVIDEESSPDSQRKFHGRTVIERTDMIDPEVEQISQEKFDQLVQLFNPQSFDHSDSSGFRDVHRCECCFNEDTNIKCCGSYKCLDCVIEVTYDVMDDHDSPNVEDHTFVRTEMKLYCPECIEDSLLKEMDYKIDRLCCMTRRYKKEKTLRRLRK